MGFIFFVMDGIFYAPFNHFMKLGVTKKPRHRHNARVLRFVFEFASKYEPNVGSVLIEGDLLYMEDSKKAKEIINSWKKDKKIDKELMTGLLNTILTRCNVQALIMSQQVNLPPPIPLPKVQISASQDKNYIG